MTAEMFTKGLAKTKFAKLREKPGIKDIIIKTFKKGRV